MHLNALCVSNTDALINRQETLTPLCIKSWSIVDCVIQPMRIHCSEPFKEELTDQPLYIFEKRGEVDVKVCESTCLLVFVIILSFISSGSRISQRGRQSQSEGVGAPTYYYLAKIFPKLCEIKKLVKRLGALIPNVHFYRQLVYSFWP